MNYATESVSERCQLKQKGSEEQYKEQQFSLCGELLEHALTQMGHYNWHVKGLLKW